MSRSSSSSKALICAIGLLAPLCCATAGTAADDQSLARAFKRLPMYIFLDQAGRAQFARYWSLIDQHVVGELNSGRSLAQVGKMLTELPGYQGPKESSGTQIGGAVFYAEGDKSHDAGYQLLQPYADDDNLIVGVFNGGFYGPGRVSIYHRRDNSWRRSSIVDAKGPISAYVLSSRDADLTVAVIDTLEAADRTEGTLAIWKETHGTLARTGFVFKELVDFDVELADQVLKVNYDAFPRHMCIGVMGERIEYQLTIALQSGHVKVVRTVLTPWFAVINDLYGYKSAGQLAEARGLFAKPADLDLIELKCGSIRKQEGSLSKGRAWAEIEDYENAYRLDLEKRGRLGWKIVKVREID